MKQILYFTCALLILNCARMETKWVALFDVAGEGNYTITDISSYKDTYVTGTYWTDDMGPFCITAKYDEDGNPEWHIVYEVHDFKSIQGKSIEVLQTEEGILDIQRGVYVYIRAVDRAGRRNSVLVKYDSLGNLEWERILQKSADESERESMMLSDYAGDIYTAGLRTDLHGAVTVFITKYSQAGVKLWSTSYYNPTIRFRHIKCDVRSPDQFIIGGILEEGRDLCYLRYDSIGTLVSITRHESPEQEDVLADIKIDMQGNVYMAGVSTSSETDDDYLTVVYSRDNDLLWQNRYDGRAHLDDIPKAVTVDDSFNVYVTGKSQEEDGTTDIVTIKYDKEGNEMWKTTFSGKKNESAEPYSMGPGFMHFYSYKSSDVPVFSIAGTAGTDVVFLSHSINGFYSWTTRYKGEGERSAPTALSRDCIAVQTISGEKTEAHLLKYGKAELFGIARWD